MTWDFLLIVFLPLGIGGFATIVFSSVGESMGLVDYPDHRKHHQQPTMTTGGLSVFVTLLISSIILLPKEQGMLVYFVCSSMLIILGLLDDTEDIPATHRLIAQAVIALLMCSQGNIYIVSLGNLLGFGTIELGYLGYLLTVFAVIAAINAFNMIDGIDGLLGSTALIVFSALSLLFAAAGDTENLKFSLLIALSIIPYLWVNLQIRPVWLSKIFMGDTGSMLIGFSAVWFLIQGSQGELRSFSVVTALWLICFPLMDMARVMLVRRLNGKSMMEADRTHLHHLLTDNPKGKRSALVSINIFSISAALIGIALEIFQVPEHISFIIFLMSFVLYVYSIQKKTAVWSLLEA